MMNTTRDDYMVKPTKAAKLSEKDLDACIAIIKQGESVQAVDDPAITVSKFSVYGGLASYEKDISPQTLGSYLVSMTGPAAAFRHAGS